MGFLLLSTGTAGVVSCRLEFREVESFLGKAALAA